MQEQTILVDGQLVAASHWSSSAQAEPVVLLHGFPMDRHLWDDIGERLSDSHPVFAFDLPGFGGSGARGSVLGMPETADWLAAVLAAFRINSPIALVGLSMGGYIALEFAARYPQRLSRLVLCSTRAESDGDEARKGRIEMAEAVDHLGVEAIADALLPKLLAKSTRTKRPQAIESLREMIHRTAPSTIAAAQRGMAVRRAMLDELPAWSLPIACLAGDEDALTGPEVMNTIVQAARDARMQIITGSGHVAPLEDPPTFARALLDSLSGGSSR